MPQYVCDSTDIREEQTFEVRIPPEPPPVKCVRISKNEGKPDTYKKLLKKAVELSENVREAGKNMSSSIVPIRVVGEKQKVDMEMIRKMKIPYSIKDNQVILTVLGVTDNGADTGVEIDRLRKILGKDRLADAASGLQGVNSTSSDKERNIITILTVDNDPINIDVRSVRDLGISKNANVTYMKAV